MDKDKLYFIEKPIEFIKSKTGLSDEEIFDVFKAELLWAGKINITYDTEE